MADPDLLYINVEQRVRSKATHADFYVRIGGKSFIAGQEALKKAKEVAALVEDLLRAGVPEQDIELQGVVAKVKTGKITSSSSAEYHLKIRCTNLSAYGDILGAVTSQENAVVGQIEWGYEDEEDIKMSALADCIEKAKRKAHKVADALNVKLGIVYTYTDEWVEAGPRFVAMASARYRQTGGKADYLSSEDLGMTVKHSREMILKVKVKFHVSA